jgi:hypothetical protein
MVRTTAATGVAACQNRLGVGRFSSLNMVNDRHSVRAAHHQADLVYG